TLQGVETFVLDEADQMLDMGFIVPIRRIVKHIPAQRQNLFFSATMPTEIGKLAGELLKDPLKVSVTPQATTVERITQKVLFVEQTRKRALLAELFAEKDFKRVIVFTRTKRGADRVAKSLEQGGVEASAIHGDKSQGQRERALADFKAGKIRALVATDIAARGIDVDAVSHVVQYELPNVPEAYVHRIGRTARAGADGSAIAFCADDERNLLRDIQKVTRQTIPSFDRRNDKGLALMTKAIADVTPEEPRLPSGRSRDPRNDVPAALRQTRNRRPDQGRGGGEGRGGGQPRRDGAKPAQAAKASVGGGGGGDRFRGPKREGAAKAWSPID
ncbi:MAG: helicase-related protein, partial [Phenylobacterium sp.]|nr:helicase-related protein [Phenylobacterium sp.]